ncbi:MAG: diguanylate cyclase [Desulfobacterota bacterium]|nr:diguanylate cyclase [Thermodesulfobacteriota bacterium]
MAELDKKNVSVLIVDDEATARDMVADILTDDGYTVTATDSGENALKLLERSSFDLIISDLMMQGMNGIELTKRIKAAGVDAPIIVITGFATIEHAVESMKAGAYDFITKPFNIDQIKITVQKALETKRLQRLAGEREFYKQLSNSDELTALANYRYFNEMLQKEVERAIRYGRPLSLMMIDIDNFKTCNDTYGHLAGDMVLKQIAELIKKTTRDSDLVARYGGEEFTVILPETTEDEARVVAERIRDVVSKTKFTTDTNKAIGPITVTIGLSTLPLKAATKRDLVRTADFALYQGKSAGKNRVVIFSDAKRTA